MTTDEYKKKCEWLAGFYAEAARTERQMQMRIANHNWITNNTGPDAGCDASDWRLKPEPQKAWVVWCKFNGQWQTVSFPNAQKAERFATPRNGTIQEITRPEPQ